MLFSNSISFADPRTNRFLGQSASRERLSLVRSYAIGCRAIGRGACPQFLSPARALPYGNGGNSRRATGVSGPKSRRGSARLGGTKLWLRFSHTHTEQYYHRSDGSSRGIVQYSSHEHRFLTCPYNSLGIRAIAHS